MPISGVPEAAALNAAFTKRLVELDEEFEARNADPAHWTRIKGREDVIPYTLLMPGSRARHQYPGNSTACFCTLVAVAAVSGMGPGSAACRRHQAAGVALGRRR